MNEDGVTGLPGRARTLKFDLKAEDVKEEVEHVAWQVFYDFIGDAIRTRCALIRGFGKASVEALPVEEGGEGVFNTIAGGSRRAEVEGVEVVFTRDVGKELW